MRSGTSASNPYTRIRLQAEEIETYRGHLLAYEHTYQDFKNRAKNTMRGANMDIHLLMTIIKDLRPWVAPGTLDGIVRKHVVRRGVSPATTDLLDMIKDTRQTMFIPIARQIHEDMRSSTPVTDFIGESKAFGLEEELEKKEEEFLIGEAEVMAESEF